MNGGLFQIVITVWLGAHPFTHTLPQLYSPEDCEIAGKHLATRGKKKSPARKIEIECVSTNKRDI